MSSLVRIAMLAVVLALALFNFGAPSMAQNVDPLDGSVIYDGTPCYERADDTEPWTWLTAQTEAMVYTDPTEPRMLIGINPDPETGSRDSCWVESSMVSVGMGYQSEESSSDNQSPPITHTDDNPFDLPDGIIRTDFVNANGVNCRIGPSLDASPLTTLYEWQEVDILAESQNGWTWIGTEGGQCFVSSEFIGAHTETTQIVPVASEPTIVPIVEEPSAIEGVWKLPDTGSGVEAGSPLGILIYPIAALAFIILAFVAKWSWDHKDAANQRRKTVNRYFGGRDQR